jgi:hypothetical protein
VLAGAEAGLRAYTRLRGGTAEVFAPLSRQAFRTSATPGLRYELSPAREAVRVNEFGFRGESFPPAKAVGEKRIFLVGDSVVFGFGIRDDQTLDHAMQEIADRTPRAGLRFINAGVPGYSAAQFRAVIENKLPAFDPDAFVVLLNDGDLWCPQEPLLLRNSAEAWLAHRSVLYVRLVRTFPRIIGIRSDPDDEIGCSVENAAALRAMSHSAHRAPGRWLFVLHGRWNDRETDPEVGPRLERIRWILGQEDVPYLRGEDAIRARFGRLDDAAVGGGDTVHPNAEAVKAIAAAIYKQAVAIGMLPGDQGENESRSLRSPN